MTNSNIVEYNRAWAVNTRLLSAVRAELLQSNPKGEFLIAACGGFIADFLPLVFGINDIESLDYIPRGMIESAAANLRKGKGNIEYAIRCIVNANALLQNADPFDARLADQGNYQSMLYALRTLANAGNMFIVADAASKIDCRYAAEEVRNCPQVFTEAAFREATLAGLQILPILDKKDKALVITAFDGLIKVLIKSGVRNKAFNRYWCKHRSQKRALALKFFEQNREIGADEQLTEPVKVPVEDRILNSVQARGLIADCFRSAQASDNSFGFLEELRVLVAPQISRLFKSLYRGFESFEEVREPVIKSRLEAGAKYLMELDPVRAAIELHEALRQSSSVELGGGGYQRNLRTAKVLDNILYYLSFTDIDSPARNEVWKSREQALLSVSEEDRTSFAIDGLFASLMEVAAFLDERQMRTQADRPGYDTANFLATLGNAVIEAGLAAGILPFTEEQLLWEAICAPIEAEERAKCAPVGDPNSV